MFNTEGVAANNISVAAVNVVVTIVVFLIFFSFLRYLRFVVAFVVVIGVNNILDTFVCVAREFLFCCCCSCKHTLDVNMCVSVLVECCTLNVAR